jgi:hypothetical protein
MSILLCGLLTALACVALSSLAVGFALSPWRDLIACGLLGLSLVWILRFRRDQSRLVQVRTISLIIIGCWVASGFFYFQAGLALPFQILARALSVDGESAYDARAGDVFLVALTLGFGAFLSFQWQRRQGDRQKTLEPSELRRGT